MKVMLVRNTIVNGEARSAGDVVDVKPHDARYLIGRGKAVEFATRSAPERAVATRQRKKPTSRKREG